MVHKRAIIMYGPPGAGKGTQATLLERKFNFIHVDTGRYIEGVVHSPEAKRDPILRREQILFDSGKLCTPSWTLKIIREAATRIGRAGFGLVFSGSPRTLYEAIGDKQNPGLVQTLEKFYGKKQITVIFLDIRPQTTLRRNSNRLVCSVCGSPVLAHAKTSHCLFCAAPLRRRTLDSPKVIKVRLKEFKERTYPILKEMKRRGWTIKKINAEGKPYKVFDTIVSVLELR